MTSKASGPRPCANPACSKPTLNPRFCSKSCAATVNNSASPKRRPESVCSGCHTPVRSGVRLCSECLSRKREEEVARERLGYVKQIMTINGELLETPCVRVSVSKVIRFSASCAHDRKLTVKSRCGDIIDMVIGFCLSGPECLEEVDAHRYASLLHDLKEFELPRYARNESSPAAKDQALTMLGLVLEEWVFSQFGEGRSGILPHYALATADLILKLLQGHWKMEPERWEFESLIREENFSKLSLRSFDVSFKRRFTELSHHEFAARVPTGVSVSYRGEVFYSAGNEFFFEVKRCHLSQSINDFSMFNVEGVIPQRFNLMDDFLLRGSILIFNEHGQPIRQWPFHLPPNWIIWERSYERQTGVVKRRDLPKPFQMVEEGPRAPLTVQ